MKNICRKLLFHFFYFGDPPWDTKLTPPEVHEFIAKNRPGLALDLGCGTGTNAITLAKNGWTVMGVDFIGKAIRTARHKAKSEGVSVDFKVGDVTKLAGIDGPFDLILDIGCYHGLNKSEKQAYRDKINQLLRPGGTYLLYLFFKSDDNLFNLGARENDIAPFSDFLKLVHRQDGTERGIRRSSWLTYWKKPN